MDDQQISDLLNEIRNQTQLLSEIRAGVANSRGPKNNNQNNSNRDIERLNRNTRELGRTTREAAEDLSLLGEEADDASKTMSAVASAAGRSAKSIGSFITQLGRHSNEVSSNLTSLNPAINLAGKAASGLANALGDGAFAIAGLTAPLGGVGIALAGVAGAVGIVSKVLAAGADKAAEAMQWYTATLQEMSSQYSAISQYGGVAADGLTGVATKANKLMVGLGTLSTITSSYGKDLALVHGSVSSGLTNIADTADALGRGTREHLASMGILLEEQAESIAAYSRVQVWSGRREKLTLTEMAAAAESFVKESDAFAKMTGLSSKEMQAKIAAEFSRVQFGAIADELNRISGNERKGDTLAAAVASAESKFGPELAEIMRSGVAGVFTGKENAVMSSIIGDDALRLGQMARSGAISGDQYVESILKALESKGSALAARQLEMKGGQVMSPEMQSFLTTVRMISGSATDMVSMRKAAKDNQTITDDAAKNVAATAMAVADITKTLNEEFIKTLPKATEVMKGVANTMKTTVDKFKEGIDYFIKKFGVETENFSSAEHARAGTGNYSPQNLGQPDDTYERYSKKTPVASGPNAALSQLGDIISRGESNPRGQFKSAYDVPFAYGKHHMPEKPLTEMSLNEVLEFQKRQIQATKGKIGRSDNLGTGAVGKYQFNQGNLKTYFAELEKQGVDLSTAKFTPELQDQLFARHLGSTWQDFISGKVKDPTQLASKITAEWEIFQKRPDLRAALPGQLQTLRGFKTGGISRGPTEGYTQLLHGTEAVVPLPDGKAIPVDLAGLDKSLMSAIGNMAGPTNTPYAAFKRPNVEVEQQKPVSVQLPELRELNTKMTDQMSAMQIQISRLSEMVDILRRSMNVNEKILQASRN